MIIFKIAETNRRYNFRMANDHRKGKGKGRRDPSPRDRRRDNRSNDRNDERPSRGARSGDRSNDRRGPVSPRPQGAPQQ